MSACKIPQLFRADENYWQEKLAAFLHDPPDKALSIWGHVKRADFLKSEIYVSADEELVKRADQVASGLDRTFLPEKEDNGEIKFSEDPRIAHPTGLANALDIGPVGRCATEKILSLIQKDETALPKAQPQRAFALFHYFRHVLPYRLCEENICDLSWRWLRLPADTRLPDHSIWQHCALTSALYSCYRLSPDRKASLMVFSLTPVQDFIARSRKLRDYWTASLILSWLAAEGMKAVICHYGSDHIIYPSPIGQALIESFLDREGNFAGWSCRYHQDPQAATLPNKFLFLVPAGEEEEAGSLVQNHIKRSWLALAGLVQERVCRECFQDVSSECLKAFERIFTRQVARFWEFHWAAVPLLDKDALREARAYLPPRLTAFFERCLAKAEKCGLPYRSYTEKFFYPLVHDLLGRGLAAEKLSPEEGRAEEPGIKGHLHPDLEALRFSCVECERETCPYTGLKPDPNPRPSQDLCWQKIRAGFSKTKTDFKETERLSAIGLIKRLAYQAVPKDHPLSAFFKEAERFPSTTEMALSDWCERAQEEMKKLELTAREVAEILHRQEAREKYEIEDISKNESKIQEKVRKLLKAREEAKDKPSIVDRYYAILIMDGDRMGRLLSGGFAARWRNTLHPELVRRLESGEIAERFWPCFWKGLLNEKRTLSPATHAAISQALADFALYTVPYLVKKNRGRLIYAGGDDVCAVFPVSSALQAACEIAEAYNWAFAKYGKSRSLDVKVRRDGENVPIFWEVREIKTPQELRDDDRLLLHLGPGKDISISAGLLIVHHKWPLRAAIERAHTLLDLAKDAGRAALALELQRRAGERRTFIAGFRDEKLGIKVWEAFTRVVEALACGELSSSFAYRPAQLEEGLKALRNNEEDFMRLIRSQVEHSKASRAFREQTREPVPFRSKELSRLVAAVLIGGREVRDLCGSKEEPLALEALEIANFLAEAVRRNGKYRTMA